MLGNLQARYCGGENPQGSTYSEIVSQHRYWVLGDRHRRSGFETFYRLNDVSYLLSCGILAGHY